TASAVIQACPAPFDDPALTSPSPMAARLPVAAERRSRSASARESSSRVASCAVRWLSRRQRPLTAQTTNTRPTADHPLRTATCHAANTRPMAKTATPAAPAAATRVRAIAKRIASEVSAPVTILRVDLAPHRASSTLRTRLGGGSVGEDWLPGGRSFDLGAAEHDDAGGQHPRHEADDGDDREARPEAAVLGDVEAGGPRSPVEQSDAHADPAQPRPDQLLARHGEGAGDGEQTGGQQQQAVHDRVH